MKASAELKQAVAAWWSERFEIVGKRPVFGTTLAAMVTPDMEISTDYDPDATLLAALRKSGVQCGGVMFSCDGLLPKKTMMVIRNGVVRVSEGYGAPFVQIFP